MANDPASSSIKPYQQIIASGSGGVLTALFMTLDIYLKRIVDQKMIRSILENKSSITKISSLSFVY
jgi:hypothetical protein